MSAAENIPGPRNGTGATQGQYQAPALGTSAKHWDLSAWKGAYIKLKWTPAAATPDAECRFAFYETLAAAQGATLDVGTDSGDAGAAAKIANGADVLDKNTPIEHMQVPFDCPVLKVISSVASGGFLRVRHAEQGQRDVTS